MGGSMDTTVQNALSRLKKFILEEHKNDLSKYFSSQGAIAPRRFWSLFRSDLMRKRPHEVGAYLRDKSNRISEIGEFATKLADAFFTSGNEIVYKQNHEALIYACLEMEAFYRMRDIPDPRIPENGKMAKCLTSKLKLWEAP
jgi:hypothetical protein